MSLWGSIKRGVKKVANTVEDFVNDVADELGNAVQAVGDGINDALNWVGGKLKIKPVFSWLGGIVKGVFSLVGVVIKGVFGIVGGIVGGIIKIVGGIFTWQGSLILDGLWDIISPILGTVLLVLGKGYSVVASIFHLQRFERPLTRQEEQQLKTIFKDSLTYYVIRIIEGYVGLLGSRTEGRTIGNTIYMKTTTVPLLVHETTHVWQYQQSGNRYASDALAAQWTNTGQEEYDWQREINVLHKMQWTEFNHEAQARFFEDLWQNGELHDSSGATLQTGNGSFFLADGKSTFGYFEKSGIPYTNIATEAVSIVRNEWF